MTTLRVLLLLAAAAVLPSCHNDHTNWVWVTVENLGTQSAGVQADAEYWSGEDHTDLWVNPGATVGFRFRLDSLNLLKVRIYRASDLLQIFSESWNRGELDDVDNRVFISVSP